MPVAGSQELLIYSPKYNTDLASMGIDKPFALDRGQLVLDALAEDAGRPVAYTVPEPVSDEDLLRVHTPEYLDTLKDGKTWIEILELKASEYNPALARVPLTELLTDIRLKCGGTVKAAEQALKYGLAANLGGGYHHAFPERGNGFCALNDIAVAIRSLSYHGLCRKVLVCDLDFHQGDGTAYTFREDPDVFTLSVHSQEGWPEDKQESSLDVPIATGEEHLYLDKVQVALEQALKQFSPDLVIYVAGSDPYELDVLPGTRFIKLTLDQMRCRDELVIDTFAQLSIPLAMVFAGGYGPHVWRCHYQGVRRLLERAGALAGKTATGA